MIRLGDVPEGAVIDISNTDELQKGDIIYIEFPIISAGRAKFGSSQKLTVVGVDKRPGVNKIGVTSESGELFWFDGGTKDDLLKALSDLTSYNKVVVVRPSGAVIAVQAGPPKGNETSGGSGTPSFVVGFLIGMGILGVAAFIYYQKTAARQHSGSLGADYRACLASGRLPGPPASARSLIGHSGTYCSRKGKRAY